MKKNLTIILLWALAVTAFGFARNHHRPKHTPTPTPTPTTTPVPTVSPAPTPAPALAAHGLYIIGADAAGNPNITGDCGAMYWDQVEKVEGKPDWRDVDAKIALAKAGGKQIRFTILTLNHKPAWLDAKLYTGKHYPDPYVLPFDPVVLPKLKAFAAEVCLHVDGLVNYLTFPGVGVRVESYIDAPADINYSATNDEFLASWLSSSEQIADICAANLKQTAFVLAAGTPFHDPETSDKAEQDTLTQLMTYGLKYPLFGVMQWGLNAHSATPDVKTGKVFYINQFIKDHADHPNGFQMTGTCSIPVKDITHIGGDCAGTLDDTLAGASSLSAKFVEVYSGDVTTANAPVLKTYNDKLK